MSRTILVNRVIESLGPLRLFTQSCIIRTWKQSCVSNAARRSRRRYSGLGSVLTIAGHDGITNAGLKSARLNRRCQSPLRCPPLSRKWPVNARTRPAGTKTRTGLQHDADRVCGKTPGASGHMTGVRGRCANVLAIQSWIC